MTLLAALCVPAPALAHDGYGHSSWIKDSRLGQTYGTILDVHGGGWKAEQNVRRCGLDQDHPELSRLSHDAKIGALPGKPTQSEWYANRGWRFISVGYTAGYPCSLQDALASFDDLLRQYGRPICVRGGSAGGHLALLVAVHRDVDCVISLAGPVDLNTLCWNCYRPPVQAVGEPTAQSSMYDMSSTERSSWSPVTYAADPRYEYEGDHVLLAHAHHDSYVPMEQVHRFELARPATEVRYIGPGNCAFTHTVGADCQEIRRLYERIAEHLRVLADAAGPVASPDGDGDGVADSADNCPRVAAPEGCPTFERELTLSYSKRKDKFRGRLTSTEPMCASAGEDVDVARKRRDRPVKWVGNDATNEASRYAVPREARPRRYFARVARELDAEVGICAATRSPTLRVR